MTYDEIKNLLGDEAEYLLSHRCVKISQQHISAPGTDTSLAIFRQSARSSMVVSQLQRLYHSGRLAGTGYVSIFPVDQGLEHTAAYSFYHNPKFFDPTAIVEMAIAGGCSGVTSSAAVLNLVSRTYAKQIPFIVKLNHSEHLTLPEKTDQLLFASVDQAAEMGAAGIGATIYFGADESHRQIEQIGMTIEHAHRLGMFAILWCYPRNPRYQHDGRDYSTAVDITSQAIHLGASLGADIVKQKMPTADRGFVDLKYSKYDASMYDELLTDHPIDLVRYQVAHAFMGKIGLINSGGEAAGDDDLRDAVRTAVINKRAGGHGLIMGRKVFKKSWDDGVALLNAVQDVYAEKRIDLA